MLRIYEDCDARYNKFGYESCGKSSNCSFLMVQLIRCHMLVKLFKLGSQV